MKYLADAYISKSDFSSFKECNDVIAKEASLVMKLIDEWRMKEYEHRNYESPKHTGIKIGEMCDE
jgi:hypothetical protein